MTNLLSPWFVIKDVSAIKILMFVKNVIRTPNDIRIQWTADAGDAARWTTSQVVEMLALLRVFRDGHVYDFVAVEVDNDNA